MADDLHKSSSHERFSHEVELVEAAMRAANRGFANWKQVRNAFVSVHPPKLFDEVDFTHDIGAPTGGHYRKYSLRLVPCVEFETKAP